MRALVQILLVLALVAPTTADEVVEELSRRSLVSVENLVDHLANCDRDQISMNFCAFRDAVDADLRLEKALLQQRPGLTKAEAKALNAEIAQWRTDMAERCNAQADAEAAGGSMRPAVYSFCVAEETESRLAQ